MFPFEDTVSAEACIKSPMIPLRSNEVLSPVKQRGQTSYPMRQ